MLFACAWKCSDETLQLMNVLLFDYLWQFLPCEACKRSFMTKIENKKRTDRFKDGDELFTWLWSIKDEINNENNSASLSLVALKKRFELHGRLIDEVALADTLVIMAIFARRSLTNSWADFVSMCSIVSQMLPCMNNLSVLKQKLNPNNWSTNNVKMNVFEEFIIHAAQSVRSNRGGIFMLQLEDYKKILSVDLTSTTTTEKTLKRKKSRR